MNSHPHQTPTEMKCYYCDGVHCIDECERVKKDKVKYNLDGADITKKYKGRLFKNAKKSNILINEATLSSRPQESTYSVEQAEQFITEM